MSQQDDTKLGWRNSTNDWRATLRSGSLCRKVLGTCRSEIVMDLNARRWFTSMEWDEIEHQWAELQARASYRRILVTEGSGGSLSLRSDDLDSVGELHTW